MTTTPSAKARPDPALRKARRGIWEAHRFVDPYDAEEVYTWHAPCAVCHEVLELNILGYCRACAFRDKLSSITVIAEPWALREVRRQYGHRGESSPSDQERKYRHDVADDEWRRSHGLSVGEPPKEAK